MQYTVVPLQPRGHDCCPVTMVKKGKPGYGRFYCFDGFTRWKIADPESEICCPGKQGFDWWYEQCTCSVKHHIVYGKKNKLVLPDS